MLIESIAARAKVDPDDLRRIASNASRRYHEFEISKRDGTPRIIAHPSRPLKALQRFLARNIFSLSPVHPAATAYVKGSSIRKNAEIHAHSHFTIRLDFSRFFPSFDELSVQSFTSEICYRNSIPISDEDLKFVVKIVCRSGSLPIGAPSSPRITNAMMFDFDNAVFSYCENANVVYTRYADDIFLSGIEKNKVASCANHIRYMVSQHSRPKLMLNNEKTLYLSRAGHRSITGLVITPDGQISIGRSRKREIKTLAYLAINGKLNSAEGKYFSGLIAFCHDVEPDFIRRLNKKFDCDILSFVKQSYNPQI